MCMERGFWWVLLFVYCSVAHAKLPESSSQEPRQLHEQALQLYDSGHYAQAIPIARRAPVVLSACDTAVGEVQNGEGAPSRVSSVDRPTRAASFDAPASAQLRAPWANQSLSRNSRLPSAEREMQFSRSP
jgi:hypothetical protein